MGTALATEEALGTIGFAIGGPIGGAVGAIVGGAIADMLAALEPQPGKPGQG